MVSPALSVPCTVLRVSIVQVKDLSKLGFKPVSILWPPNHMSRQEANMARLHAITDENNLDYSLVPVVRLRIICTTINHLYHLPLESHQISLLQMHDTAVMLVA